MGRWLWLPVALPDGQPLLNPVVLQVLGHVEHPHVPRPQLLRRAKSRAHVWAIGPRAATARVARPSPSFCRAAPRRPSSVLTGYPLTVRLTGPRVHAGLARVVASHSGFIPFRARHTPLLVARPMRIVARLRQGRLRPRSGPDPDDETDPPRPTGTGTGRRRPNDSDLRVASAAHVRLGGAPSCPAIRPSRRKCRETGAPIRSPGRTTTSPGSFSLGSLARVTRFEGVGRVG